jgi:hypothetical protein
MKRVAKAGHASSYVVILVAVLALVGCGGEGEQQVEPSLAVRKSWLGELRRRAKEEPAARFDNLPRAVFYARLHAMEARYGFQLVEARILQPVQDAPLVVVKTQDAQAFSRAVPAIQHLLDPKRRTNDDRTGWAYEGFYLEAQDTQGTPFLAIFNYWRGTGVGGGQWASSESLFPFDHGSHVRLLLRES